MITSGTLTEIDAFLAIARFMLSSSTRIGIVSYYRPKRVYIHNCITSHTLLIRHTHNISSPGSNSEARDASRNESNPHTTAVLAKETSAKLENLCTLLRERATSLSSAASVQFAQLGGKLNQISGYEHIESLKTQVVQNEAAILTKRQAARDAKIAYDEAVARRSNSQKEVNDLLQRKSFWTESDVGRFTALVRQDHLYEQEEARAKLHVETSEADVEHQFNELMRTILNRYHEEQVWSDKIRSASTYGSLLALGANIFLFFLAIIVVEPWKRKRLAQTFERRIEHLSIENRELIRQGLLDVTAHHEKQGILFEKLEHILEQLTLSAPGSQETKADVPEQSQSIESEVLDANHQERWLIGLLGAASGVALTTIFTYFRS